MYYEKDNHRNKLLILSYFLKNGNKYKQLKRNQIIIK